MGSILGALEPEVFVRDYWQRKPLLVRQALADFADPISADELAGLSLEPSVESRLIMAQGARPWELHHGPFQESLYQRLPERDWTLLVQAVDQWVPAVAKLLRHFTFLPSWRIDDVMISYAAPGGGVGPHFDHYDVFLLQGQGRRRWRIGSSCDADSPLLPHPDLRILANFQPTDEWVLEPGDMLYLPPGVAHDGVALEDCLTYSIGFRAPSTLEAASHFTDYLAQTLSDDQRYSDAGMAFTPDPQRISDQAVLRLKALLGQVMSDDALLLRWFGEFMTEPRYPELMEENNGPDWAKRLKEMPRGLSLGRSDAARLAWAQNEAGVVLFASGQSYPLPDRLRGLVQLLCGADQLTDGDLRPWLADREALEMLARLLQQGCLQWRLEGSGTARGKKSNKKTRT